MSTPEGIRAMSAHVELIPFGTSEIERAGIPFTDKSNGTDLIRVRVKAPTEAATISIKSETDEGAGPVWIDGVPVYESRL